MGMANFFYLNIYVDLKLTLSYRITNIFHRKKRELNYNIELVKSVNFIRKWRKQSMKKLVLVLLSGLMIISSTSIISHRNNKKVSNDKSGQALISKNEKELFTAIENNEIVSVKKLIIKNVDINYKDNDGETALEKSVKADNKDIVKFLISKGANLNTMDKQKSTPLSVIRSESMMNLLLSKGANANTMVFAGDGEIDETAIEVAKYIVAILPN